MSIPAKRAGRKSPAVSISKKVYTMATVDGSDAEITMYGDIYEEQPTNWWGEPVEGQYILLSEFLEDLKQISGCTSITIRMNSYGGDAGASNMIHNRLRELARNGTKLTCIVDGVAMSGGSLIMCACDTVKVNPSSLVMIHKCWTFLWGGYNADELREQASQQEAWDKMQMEVYTRKTGLSATVISHMMADTTYMTGREAIDKGFADELIEDAEPTSIAASADGRSLFVNGRQMHLAPGMFAPDNIPTVTPEASAPVETDKNKPEVTGDEGGISMTKEELRAKYPDEIAQVEADARASVDHTEAVNTAIQAERARMQEIDEISGLLDATDVQQAKYGDKPCSAADLLMAAAKNAAKQGKKFLTDLKDDSEESGAEGVPAAPAPAVETPEGEDGEIRVGKELDGLGLRRVRVQRRDVRLRRALLQQGRKQARIRLRRRAAARTADHDAARMQVIIQCPALAQKLRREQQPLAAKPAHNALRIADRHCGLDDHKRAGIDPAHEREHRLDGRGVEDLPLGVVVRRRGDDDHVCRAVGLLGVYGGRERERLRAQKVRDLGVDDRRDAAVDVFGFGGGRGHGGDGVVLREQHRLRQTDIAHAGYGDVHIGPPVSQMISG